MKPEDLLKPMPFFNNSSMITGMIHIINTYVFWLANCARQEQRPEFSYEVNKNIHAVQQLYIEVDVMMHAFLQRSMDSFDMAERFIRQNGTTLTRTPFDLFTHVITHEFHHKGQLLMMSRQMGYTPVDTDVIRD